MASCGDERLDDRLPVTLGLKERKHLGKWVRGPHAGLEQARPLVRSMLALLTSHVPESGGTS